MSSSTERAAARGEADASQEEKRRRKAEKKVRKMKAEGGDVSPVLLAAVSSSSSAGTTAPAAAAAAADEDSSPSAASSPASAAASPAGSRPGAPGPAPAPGVPAPVAGSGLGSGSAADAWLVAEYQHVCSSITLLQRKRAALEPLLPADVVKGAKKLRADGKPAAKRAPSGFSLFYKSYRQGNVSGSMVEASHKWRLLTDEQKAAFKPKPEPAVPAP